jgi:hypothetical protein
MKRGGAKRRVVFLLGLGVVAAGLIGLMSRHSHRRAEILAFEVDKLEVGVSSSQDVRRLAEDFGGVPVDKDCDPDNCAYGFEIENAPLYQLGLAPWTAYKVHLATEDRKLTFISLTLTTVTGRSFFTGWESNTGSEVYSASILRCLRVKPEISLQFLTPEKPWRAVAKLPPKSKPNYALNLGCLSRIGGCKDGRELLPAAWNDPENQWQIEGTPPPSRAEVR